MATKEKLPKQSHTIRVDEEVFALLKKQSTSFQDTPNLVLRRLFGMDKKESKK